MSLETTVPLRRFYGEAADINIPLDPTLFIPDVWTETLAAALQKQAALGVFEGQRVLEVGVGTGINVAGLLTSPLPPKHITGSDICNHAVAASQSLADRLRLNGSVELVKSDLLSLIEGDALRAVDHIIACIPQVADSISLSEGDNYAHYYNPTGSQWDDYGLGLNGNLLKQANIRAPQASITLNLSGRPGIDLLKSFFKAHERTAEVLHESVVPQHIGTSLASFAELEKAGAPDFEFFNGHCGTNRINAREAEDVRAREAEDGVDICSVTHKIYVINAPRLRR